MTAKIIQNDFVRYESDALALKLGRFVWQMHLVAAILLVALIWPKTPAVLSMFWGGLMGGLTILLAIICFRGAAQVNKDVPLGFYPLAFDICSIALATSWAFFIVVLVPDNDTELRNYTEFIIGGAILTITGMQNLRYKAMAVAVILIIVTQCFVEFAHDGSVIGIFSVGMLLVFMSLMLGLGWMLRQFTRRGFVLQWEKTQLAQKLEAQADALEKARAVADAANDAKSRFLAQASHDLRQPIHSIGLHLASLSGEKLTPRTSSVMSRIGQSVEILSKLFNSLLDVTLLDTRQLEPKMAEFNLGALIAEISDEFSLAAEAENVVLKPDGDDVFIKSDPLLVRRILQNLIANAIRHTDGGDVDLYTQAHNGSAFMVVHDTGRGIADADQALIFEEFTQGGPVGDATVGLGLGLAIVRRLSDVLKVKIDFSSKEGEGTRFSIGPFESTNDPGGAETVTPIDIRETIGRALIIDDDRPTLEATAALLSNWGWDIDARTNLSSSEIENLQIPNLIISDYDLGFGRTGLEAIAKIRAKHGFIPALVITGNSSADIRKTVLNAGHILLHKPVRPVQLRSAILGAFG